MSSHDPSGLPQQPEYLGTGESPSARRTPRIGRKGALVGAAVVAVVGAVGAGGWAAMSLMSGGSSPATAVPADAAGYVSLDLDPSASQKIEAFRILRKFPGLEKHLHLGSRDDIRELVVTEIAKEDGCRGLDYENDVAPWVGDRVALAVVPARRGGGEPTPMAALQVTDRDTAATGLKKILACSGGPDQSGLAFTGDYAVLSDSDAHATSLARRAESSSLADDATFQSWTKKVGDPGIVTMYAAPEAPRLLADMDRQQSQGLITLQGETPRPSRDVERLSAAYKGFKGMAGVVRFHDGAVEAEFAGKGAPGVSLPAGGTGTSVTQLPASTAAALSVSLQKHWLRGYLDTLSATMGDGMSADRMMRQAEAATGLRLPEDAEALLGNGFSVALDGSTDFASLMRNPDAGQVPAGIRITGDPAEITRVITKLKAAAGPQAGSVVVERGDGVVAVGLDRAYVRRLASDGTLGDDASFRAAVPDADRAAGVLYVSFDAGGRWAERLGDLLSEGDAEVAANLAPLDALGISSWADPDGTLHGLLRVTTD